MIDREQVANLLERYTCELSQGQFRATVLTAIECLREDVSSAPRMYLAVGFRWGAENAHQYFVYCGTDRGKAIALARLETIDRGGKYAVAVYEFSLDGGDYTQVFYSPSSMEHSDAPGPEYDWRKDYFETLGHFVDDACDGFVYLPVEGDASKGMKHTAVEVPEYLREERERGLSRLKQLNDIQRQRAELGAAPTPATLPPTQP